MAGEKLDELLVSLQDALTKANEKIAELEKRGDDAETLKKLNEKVVLLEAEITALKSTPKRRFKVV
jgi:hypothetical protein